ncbi:hypothetical protein PI124_g20298 [Phytophthora idaei]|nr:hypothetical protein PI125_g7746 [Phytophthora idaei]KAG3136821.1 hypothetical protein PI126_g17645 [Phytophthora idaei]KAG3234645.1 hypothetical protein PI124_g20298 [Phytophthora idaei]
MTLCTVTDGSVLVEVCNASTEEVENKSGAYVAAVTIVPTSMFETAARSQDETLGNICVVLSSATGNDTTNVGTEAADMAAALDNSKEDDFEVDFQDSSLGAEQRRVFVEMLKDFRGMAMETSNKPGRTDLLKFSIDTGTHMPVKPPPYRVSKAE